MKYFLLILLFVAFGYADQVIFKDGRVRNGQTILISGDVVTVEVLDIRNGQLKNSTFPRASIDKIVDESGVVLFEKGRLKVTSFKPYYNPFYSNWEDLRMYVTGQKDSLVLKSGKTVTGRIVSVNRDELFILPAASGKNRKKNSLRLWLSDIRSVNGYPVIVAPDSKPLRKEPMEVFPVMTANAGLSFLSTTFTDFGSDYRLAVGDNDLPADLMLSDRYLALELSSYLLFNQYLSLGVTGDIVFSREGTSYQLAWLSARYTFVPGNSRLWLEGSYGATALSHTLKSQNYEYLIDANTLGPGIGLGLDHGRWGDWGVSVAAHYFFFGRQAVSVDFLDTPVAAPELNFNMFRLSIALQLGGSL